MKKIFISILILSVTVLTVVGCSRKSKSTDTTNSTDSTSPTSDSTASSSADNTTQDSVNAADYVILPELSSVIVNNSTVQKIFDDEIAGLKTDLSDELFTEVSDASEAALKGYCVNINYKGVPVDTTLSLSESTLSGMDNTSVAAGHDLILGSNSFIPGFEDGLIGRKKGETVVVKVTFPEGYSTELGGVEVNFTVTINSVSKLTVETKHTVSLEYTAEVVGAQASEQLEAILEAGLDSVVMSDKTSQFSTFFTLADIYDQIIGKNKYESVEVTLVLPSAKAAEYEMTGDVSIKYTITVDTIKCEPEEITDEMVAEYTGNTYTTKTAFYEYIMNAIKSDYAFKAVEAAAEYKEELPESMVTEYYDYYYDAYVKEHFPDVEELSDEQKSDADAAAKENSTAIIKQNLLIYYLIDKCEINLTDEQYWARIQEEYNKYMYQYYYQGITSAEALEEYYGSEYLHFQIGYEYMLDKLVSIVNFKDVE